MDPRPKVLFVDDEEQILKYIRLLLSDQFECILLDNYTQAKQWLSEHAHSLRCIVADLRLGTDNGVDLIKLAEDMNPRCARIVCSAFIQESQSEELLAAGLVDKVVHKPVAIPELGAAIQEAMRA